MQMIRLWNSHISLENQHMLTEFLNTSSMCLSVRHWKGAMNVCPSRRNEQIRVWTDYIRVISLRFASYSLCVQCASFSLLSFVPKMLTNAIIKSREKRREEERSLGEGRTCTSNWTRAHTHTHTHMRETVRSLHWHKYKEAIIPI